jgi:ech hydrogenase subunit F
MRFFPMTRTILKNLFEGHATRLYPQAEREPFESVRGDLHNDVEKCIFCGICQRTCPSFCLEVRKQERLWVYQPFSCVFCGLCVEKCPTGCLSMAARHRPPAAAREVIVLEGPPERVHPAEQPLSGEEAGQAGT